MKRKRTPQHNKVTGNKITDGSVKRYKTLVLTSVIAVGSSAAILYFGVRFYKKYIRENAERQSFDKAAAASYARRLKMAFENDYSWGWGTDEERVYKVLEELPSRQAYSMVSTEYKSMYDRELAADLKEELSSEEADKVQEILDSKYLA